MASNKEQLDIAFQLDMDSKRVVKQISEVEKKIRATVTTKHKLGAFDSKSINAFNKAVGKTDAEIQKLEKSLSKDMRKTLETEFKAAAKSAENLFKVNEKYIKKVRTLEKQAAEETNKEAKKSLEASLGLLKKEAAGKIKAARMADASTRSKLSSGISKVGRAHGEKTNHALQFDDKNMKESGEHFAEKAAAALTGLIGDKAMKIGEDIGGSIGDILTEMGEKNAFGMAKGGLKLSASILKGLSSGASGLGGALSKKGAEKGGMAGGAMKIAGGAMKGVGSLVGVLAKLGPILGMLGGAVGMISKLFSAIDSNVTGMNKSLLEGVSTSGYLYDNGSDADKAYKSLKRTMSNIRDDATDMAENVKWGLKSEDVIKMTNALAGAGVSLETMTAEAKRGESVYGSYANRIKSVGDIARTTLAYSRLTGLSVSELTDFQAELFTSMGMGINETVNEFANMSKAANDAGISSNKFFSIIRGVSTDLDMYTTRIGQATQMLKTLGKVMSAKNAGKFMQSLTRGVKDMSEEERLKITMLAGPGASGAVSKDQDRKSKSAASEIFQAMQGKSGFNKTEQDMQDLYKAAREGGSKSGAYKELEGIISGASKEQAGTFHEALSQMTMDTQGFMKGGVLGLQEAAANLSSAGAADLKVASLNKFTPGKKLRDMTGMEGYAARKSTGTSLDEFRHLAMLQESADKERENMLAVIEKSEKGGNLTKEEAETMKRLKVLHLDNKKALASSDMGDVIAAMEPSQQEAFEQATKQIDYAEKTFKSTVSIEDKLGIISDGVFNVLARSLGWVVEGISDFLNAFMSWWGKTDPKKLAREQTDALRKSRTSENKQIIDKMLNAADSTENPADKAGAMFKAIRDPFNAALKTTDANKNTSVNMDMGDIGKTFASITKPGALGKVSNGNLAAILDNIGLDSKSLEAKGMLGVSGGKAAYGRSQMGDAAYNNKEVEGDMGEILRGLNLTNEQASKVMSALGGSGAIDPKTLANLSILKNYKDPDQDVTDSKEKDRLAKKVEEASGRVIPGQGTPNQAAPPVPGQAPPPSPTGQNAQAQKTDGVPAPVPGVQQGPPAPVTPASIISGALSGFGGAGASSSPSTMADKQVEAQEATTEAVVSGLDDLHNATRKKGIKLDPIQLDNKLKDVFAKGVLESVRTALFEYAIYTAEDPTKTLDKMVASGLSVASAAKDFKNDSNNSTFLAGHATGGMVTGIANGLANISPAPGEGLASIGKGERIVPAGGGGGGLPPITIQVNGIGGNDLTNLLRAKVNEAIYEYKRREKYN